MAVAAVDWLAAWRRWKKVRYVAKPGALLLLLAWFTQVGGWRGPLLWFGLALVFSLAGDVLLLFDGLFLAGLAAFFTAHVFYLVGLNTFPLPIRWSSLAVLAAVGGVGLGVFRQIRRGLARRENGNAMVAPVFFYSLVISLMLASALFSFWRPGWPAPAAALAATGAALFYVSDSLLAANRFVAPVPCADLWVMSTYHLGQFGLALGALAAFAS